VALACKGPLNARLATGVGLSFSFFTIFFLSFFLSFVQERGRAAGVGAAALARSGAEATIPITSRSMITRRSTGRTWARAWCD
jgi:hypothetical protein